VRRKSKEIGQISRVHTTKGRGEKTRNRKEEGGEKIRELVNSDPGIAYGSPKKKKRKNCEQEKKGAPGGLWDSHNITSRR